MFARHNTTYELPDIKQVIEKEVNETVAGKWGHFIKHIIYEEDKLWELPHFTDVLSIITLT